MGDLYYHGTCSTEDHESIFRDGLTPREKTGRGLLDPVGNRVYLTKHLSYALIYTIGAAAVGENYSPLEGSEKHGLLFAVDRKNLGNLQPDEDCVGGLIPMLNRPDGLEDSDYSPWEYELKKNLRSDPQFCSSLRNFLRFAVTPNQHKRAMDGFLAYQASAGKRALRSMPENMKAKLVEYGVHVAHEGVVRPDECWKLRLADNARLTKRTGENFFEVAERVSTVDDALSPQDGVLLPLPSLDFFSESPIHRKLLVA